MNIQQISNCGVNQYNNISFKGGMSVTAKFLEVIPDTKVCKNLTKLDKVSFQEYVNFKTHRLGITAEDIAELSKYNNDREEFILASYDFLTTKMGFSQEIRPALYFLPISAKTPMSYSPMENIIIVDTAQCSIFNNTQLFSGLRHELQHYVQNTNILRHETLAPKAIDSMVEKYIDAQRLATANLVGNNTMESLVSSGQFAPEQLELLNKARICLANKDIEGFNNLFTNMSVTYRGYLEALTAKITDTLGVIKADSSLTPKIQKTFEEFQNIGYYKQDGNVDYTKYFNMFIEEDAMQKQTYAEFEFSKEPCFMKFMKNAVEDTFKNEKINNAWKNWVLHRNNNAKAGISLFLNAD